MRLEAEVARVRSQVSERLNLEINHWDREHNRLAEAERDGRPGRIRSETAHARARAMDTSNRRALRLRTTRTGSSTGAGEASHSE